jgi:hypothetical protein
MRLVLLQVADLVGRRTPVPGPDRRRTPAELLAANDELARLMLLEVSGEPPPAMLRGFSRSLTSGAKTKYSNWGTSPQPVERAR